MITYPATFDLNAHITDITCKVWPQSNCCMISFTNLDYGTITAIKFRASGYNAFGDPVKIDNNEEFFIIIQDILLKKNESLENYRITLPDKNVRKIILQESQIVFEDGTITSYSDSNIVHYEIQEYLDGEISDDIKAARKAYYNNVVFKYKPILLDSGWVCGCGRFNTINKQKCSNCNNIKSSVLRLLEDSTDKELLAAYKNNQLQESIIEGEIARKEKHKKKKKTVFISFICLLFVAFVLLITYMQILSGRLTFDSVDAMKASVEGLYTENDYKGHPRSQIVISSTDIYEYRIFFSWPSDYYTTTYNISNWNFKNGKIDNLIVLSDGSIKKDDKVYTKVDDTTIKKWKLDVIMEDMPNVIGALGSNPACSFDESSNLFIYAFDAKDITPKQSINANYSKIDSEIFSFRSTVEQLFETAGYPNVNVECHLCAVDRTVIRVYKNTKVIYQYDGTTDSYLDYILSSDYRETPEPDVEHRTTYVEQPTKVLSFSNLKMESDSAYNKCSGTLTNNGTTTYRFVTVKGMFKNSKDAVLDTDWTYAVGNEGLAPGESTTFTLSVKKNTNITTCSVIILDYEK